MNWVHAHMYTVLCGIVGLFAVLGATLLMRESTPPPTGILTVWGGSGTALIDPSSYEGQSFSPTSTPSIALGGQNPAFGVIPPTPFAADGSIETTYDISDLIAMLSQSTNEAPASTSTIQLNSYSFIPTGLISTSTFGKVRTARQQSLYEYGNAVGGHIQSYESAHRDTTQILKNQVEDRTNSAKNEAVRVIGASLTALGTKISEMESVPVDVTGMHQALANSYKNMGALLALIPDAERDEAFVKAITVYNASADTFSKNFVALANLFSVSGVTFDSSDAGSVFTFSGEGSL